MKVQVNENSAAVDSTVPCTFGKASAVFPLSLSAAAALHMLRQDVQQTLRGQVKGYTTELTRCAGANSIRFDMEDDMPQTGNLAVLLRAPRCEGWVPGLANSKHLKDGVSGLEVVVLGRANSSFTALTYLPQETLQQRWPLNSMAEVKVLRPSPLMLPLADCPGQWLRDRLLHLCDRLEALYGEVGNAPVLEVSMAPQLRLAGLHFEGKEVMVAPADQGQRVSAEELGYWQEEADKGHRCAGSMEGSERRDVPDDIIASML